MVVSEAWHWNWVAQVDGAEVKPILADGALIGVPLSAGNHTVELSYRPLDVWVGAGLSVLAALLLSMPNWLARPAAMPLLWK